jgi:prophage antirepressor-like protein
MSNLAISKMLETGNQIRAITIPGSGIWYVAKDITNILGYAEAGSSQAIRTHCENSVRLCDISRTMQTIDWNKINELGINNQSLMIQRPDVHRLIVAAKRTKEEAAQFEKWIFEEVLEDLSDIGSYNLPNSYNSNLQNISESKVLELVLNQSQV